MSGFLGADLLDDLFDAEWRGVPFHMPDVREETGRRLVRFLFAGRDDTESVDMGALDGAMRVTGLLIGEDYIRRAERMRAAFREPGPGLLVHPWLGELDMELSEPAEISFVDRELRLARFTASFHPWQEAPPAKLDTLGQLLAALDALREGARRLLRMILAPVRLALGLVRAVVGFATSLVGMYRSSLATARNLIGLPRELEATFTGLLGLGSARADGSFGALVAARLEAPGAVIVRAGSPRLAPAIGGFSLPSDTAPLVDTAAATRLMLAISAAARDDQTAPAGVGLATAALALADAVELGVEMDFASRGEAAAMRATLDAALVALQRQAALAATTDPHGAGEVWQQLGGARAALARDMSEILGRLPAVETLHLPQSVPTWLVANHLAGDNPRQVPAQYRDLVARNRPHRPWRLPAGPIEVLR